MSALLILVPLLPLFASVLLLLAGRRMPGRGGPLVVGAIGASLAALLMVPRGTVASTAWLHPGSLNLTVGLEANGLTWFVAVLVAAIALGVGIYSLGYMANEPDRPRFYACLGLFVGTMLALVLASSFIVLFAAWEGVGLASYLLIGFKYDDPAASAAASRAFLMTRIGDLGLLLAWLLATSVTGTSDIGAVLAAAHDGSLALATPIALLALVGVVGKSAQLPLTAWLPDAMAGPTPVSALLHSATMVAAGVFLLLRLYPIFAMAPAAMTAALAIGGTTALVCGLIATSATDLKRVLAWSTSAQLGEMLVAFGLGGPLATAFHRATHAAFKSTLFVAAGAVQERMGTRDLRQLGGAARTLPLTATVFGLAALSLAGIPPLSGYWSESAILAAASRHGPVAAVGSILLLALAGIYIGRVTAAIFLGDSRGPTPDGPSLSWQMVAGMVGLGGAAVGLGGALNTRLGGLIGFAAAPPPALAWAWAAIISALASLGFGLWSGWQRGAAPALGPFPYALERAVFAIATIPARLAQAAAQATGTIEQFLDDAARAVGTGAWSLSTYVLTMEALGFGRGVDIAGGKIASSGALLGRLQSGKLYLYTLGLFAWATAVLLAAGATLLF